MSLSKEQIQKIAIAVMFVAGIYYVCFSMLIAPANVAIEKAQKDSKKLDTDIKTAENKIQTVKNAEALQKTNEEYISEIVALMPNEPPRTYYPPQIIKVFAGQSVQISQPLVSTLSPNFARVGTHYLRYGWIFSISQITYHDFGRLEAKIENENPLWEFSEIEMTATAGSEEKHSVKLILGTLNMEGGGK